MKAGGWSRQGAGTKGVQSYGELVMVTAESNGLHFEMHSNILLERSITPIQYTVCLILYLYNGFLNP